MIATRMLALPALLLAPVGTPLDADVFDASHLPSLVFDVVAPHDFAAVDLTPAMFTVQGGTVHSVAKVDPATVAVSLVIDDSPSMSDQAVQAGQGASVELIRNVGPGTQVSLSTPSGLLTALTTDQAASIARISGIVAGSPDVIKLPDLVVNAAQRLAAAPVADRHLVVALGTTFPDGPQLQALRDVIIAAGIRLDVVASSGLDTGPIAELATASGGMSPVLPQPVGEMDAVTQAIRDRYHVSASVDGPGPHDVALNVGGQTFSATLEIPVPAAPASTSAPTSTAPAGSVAPALTPTSVAVTNPAAATLAPATSTPTSESGSSGMGRGARILIALLLLAVAIAAWTTWIVLRRRAVDAAKRRTARAEARASAEAEDAPTEVEAITDADVSSQAVVPADWAPPEPLAVTAEPVAADPEPAPLPGVEALRAAVAAAEPEPEPERELEAVPDDAVAAVAPPLSIRAARRARKKARRKLGQADADAAAAQEEGAVEPAPESEPAEPEQPVAGAPDSEHEPEPVAVVPAPVAVERGPEPMAVEPVAVESVPEPELLLPVAVETEHEPAVAVVPEPEPDPVTVEPEPEPEPKPQSVAVETEPQAAPVEPEPDHEPVVVASEFQPDPESVAVEPEPEMEREPVAVESGPVAVESGPVAVEPGPVAVEPESVAVEPEPEMEREPVAVESGPVAVEPEPEVEREPVAVEPEPVEPEPEPVESEPEPVAVEAQAEDEAPAVATRRGRTPKRPRRQTSRRPATDPPPLPPPEPAPTVEPSTRRGRRGSPGMRPAADRTRRGSPADLPKRARARRRFDDIQLIEPEPDSSGTWSDHEPDWLTSGDLSVRRSTGQVFANGREVSLTASEFGALELLMNSGNDGVARDALQAAVGDQDPNLVVAQLRRKTGQRGRAPAMRKERVLRYFLADDADPSDA